MKIGIIVESLRRPLEEGIRRARELGAEGIQIYAVSRYLDMLNDSPGKLKSLKTLANDNGLAVSAVCSDLGGHGFSDPAGNPERLEKTRRKPSVCLHRTSSIPMQRTACICATVIRHGYTALSRKADSQNWSKKPANCSGKSNSEKVRWSGIPILQL